jgi:hypothetical protein
MAIALLTGPQIPADLKDILNRLIMQINGNTAGTTGVGGAPISARLMNNGGAPANISTDGVDSTPVITEVYYAEMFVDANVLATGIANFNGSVASGNIKCGLFSATGTLLATSASTAMAGTDAYQLVPFTAALTVLGPAMYYTGLFVDNTTARFNAWGAGKFGGSKQTAQTYATGFTNISSPATTFTLANLPPIQGLY